MDVVEALLELGREPATILLVPTDMVGMPLTELVRLATSLCQAVVMIGRATGADDETVRLCLELGARGVVDLPVTPERLAAAVSSAIPFLQTEPEVLTRGVVRLDLGQHRVHVRGTEVHLALREFELLEQLMRAHPQVVKVHDLARRLGGEPALTAAHIAVAIRRLRLKLHPAGSSPQEIIETVRGVGYRIVA
ncbi:MAG: winged helix-turn-helix domain-containing protein [Homoserinimonas sp.]